MTYLKTYSRRTTPQSEAIPGTNQVPNSAGGYVWAIDDWARLDRFLILGTEGGTYYIGEHALTVKAAEAAVRCIAADGLRVVRRIVEISDSGRAPKNDPALFVLSLAASLGSLGTRRAAREALPRVARIGTHLFHYIAYLKEQRGWGRTARTSVARWYTGMAPSKLAYQAVKYQSRDGWSHRDVLRKAHPIATNPTSNAVFNWIVRGWPEVGDEPHPNADLGVIWAYERAKRAKTAAEIAGLIKTYSLPREAIPTEWLTSPDVWAALLEDMPMTAMIRNLATMTRVGLLAPMSEAVKTVTDNLADAARLRASRVHPIAVLSALLTYQGGQGVRGDKTWQPVSQVVDALNEAFYLTFGNVVPANKRTVLALDVSGSMTCGMIAGVPGLTPRAGSAAIALVTAATEKDHVIVGFTGGGDWRANISTLGISPKRRLDDVVRYLNGLGFSGTDCSLPMIWALKQNVKADTFVIYTDNETWAGEIHPSQALREYREKTGIPARLVVVGMTATEFSIADPKDCGMLDVVGFDTATPDMISGFSRGEV